MSDDETYLEQYTEFVHRLFSCKPDPLIHAAMGIGGEAGEVLDTIKKHVTYGATLDRDNLLEEAGDLLFYVTALLIHSGHTVKQAIDHNQAKLNKRYPNGYSDHHATERLDKKHE